MLHLISCGAVLFLLCESWTVVHASPLQLEARDCQPSNFTVWGASDPDPNAFSQSNSINSGTIDDQISPSNAAVSRRDGEQDYQNNLIKGRQLWDRYQTQLLHGSRGDPLAPCDISKRWSRFNIIQVPVTIPDVWSNILGWDSGVMPDFEPGANEWVPAVLTNPVTNPQFMYRNFYSRRYSAIMIDGAKGVAETNGGVIRAPDRWSDVTWSYWRLLNVVEKANNAHIHYVIQNKMVNEVTNNVLDRIYNTQRTRPVARPVSNFKQTRLTLIPATDDFIALLNTPCFIGIPYLLGTYVIGTGLMTIKYIHLFRHTFDDPSAAAEDYAVVEMTRFTVESHHDSDDDSIPDDDDDWESPVETA